MFELGVIIVLAFLCSCLAVSGQLTTAPLSSEWDAVSRLFAASYQAQIAGDLATAMSGFEGLARARRGEPWPGPGGCGEALPEDCLTGFLDSRNGSVGLFEMRAAGEFAAMSSTGYRVPGDWKADPIRADARGNQLLTCLHKLDHDIEQMEHLVQLGRLPADFSQVVEEYRGVREQVAQEMTAAISQAQPGRAPPRDEYYMLRAESFSRLRGTYNSLLYAPNGPAGGPWHPTGFRRALNPNLDWGAIEEAYLSQELPLLWFDGMLTPDALEGLLRLCRESTVFFDIHPGYLGAYINDGLSSPWLVQVAAELKQMLPRVLEGMSVSNIWAYKYDSDSSMEGITVHADNAAVNLNFWLTPDEANLDKDSGGLVVYPVEPPEGTDFGSWNNWKRKDDIKAWIARQGLLESGVNVPYRQNRAVLFDSRLLHETAPFRFKQGYQNRRINLTFLFSPAPAEAMEAAAATASDETSISR